MSFLSTSTFELGFALVTAHLVGDYVCLGKVAGGPKSSAHRVVEA